MPEGDTIHRTATALRAALLEKVMTGFEAPRLKGHRPAIGAVIERVDSRGKHIEIGWDDGTILHTHMPTSSLAAQRAPSDLPPRRPPATV